MKKLLILSFSRLESDPRVTRQIELFREDWEVSTCGYGPTPAGSIRHFSVPDEFPVWRYPRALVIARQYRRAYRGNAAIAWAIEHLPIEEFDAVLANDVDAAGVAVAVRPINGFHADLHEFAPLQNSEMLRFRLFVAPFVKWQLRTFVSQAASTSTVGFAIADRYRREYGLDPAVVMNAPPLADLSPQPVEAPIRLVHAGAALRNRRLELLIEAVRATRTDVTLDLYLPPNDPGYLEELRALAAGEDRVTFREPVPFDRLVATLNGYDVGLHLLAPTNYNNANALPNKFFEYVQARLGLIIGPSPEMTSVMSGYGFGLTTSDFTADALTTVLDGLTPERVGELKQAADAAAPVLCSATQAAGWVTAMSRLRDRAR